MKLTDEKARQIARSILADGHWLHNHYDYQGMEDAITKVLIATVVLPNPDFVPTDMAKTVYKAAQSFFYEQRLKGFIYNADEAVALKAALYDMDRWTGFKLSTPDRFGVLAESSSGTYRIAERVTPAGHYITHPELYSTEQACRDAITALRRKENQIP